VRIAASDPALTVLLQQFSNPRQPQIHPRTPRARPEIWTTPKGPVGVLVAGVVQTGGTITGRQRYIKTTWQPLGSGGGRTGTAR